METDVAVLVDEPRSVAAEAPSNPPKAPKSELFEWCAKHHLKPPVFELTAVRDGFEGTAQLTFADGTTLKTNVHAARSKKPLEHAACAEMLGALERLLGADRIPPKRPGRRGAKAPAAPKQETPEQARARAKAQAKEQARRERRETLVRLLATVSPATMRETFAILKSRCYVQNIQIRVTEQRGALLLMEARCVRPDGSTVHLMPFKAASKADGELYAMAQILESVATSVGVRRVGNGRPRRASSGRPERGSVTLRPVCYKRPIRLKDAFMRSKQQIWWSHQEKHIENGEICSQVLAKEPTLATKAAALRAAIDNTQFLLIDVSQRDALSTLVPDSDSLDALIGS